MQAVDSKGTGQSVSMKRAAGGSSVNLPNKRQKVMASTVKDAIVPKEVKEAAWVADPNQVFRFLYLPGGWLLAYSSEPRVY